MPEAMTDLDDMRRYSNALRLGTTQEMDALAEQLFNEDITLAEWQTQMKEVLRRQNYYQFITGKGGDKTQIRYTEYLKLGSELKHQYAHLARFAAEIYKRGGDGRLTVEYIRSRSKLYGNSTQAMFWKSAVPVKIPQYPRDGKTRCKTGCKCRLKIKRYIKPDGVEIHVWWIMQPAEHCEDCLRLSREWNPLILTEGATTESDNTQALILTVGQVVEDLYVTSIN